MSSSAFKTTGFYRYTFPRLRPVIALDDGLHFDILFVSSCIIIYGINILSSFIFFFQRENLEMFLKGCENYGLKSQDLFQVNDLYEHKNLYMVLTTTDKKI